MNVHVQVFVQIYIFISLGQISRSGIAEFYDNSVLSIWRKSFRHLEIWGCTSKISFSFIYLALEVLLALFLFKGGLILQDLATWIGHLMAWQFLVVTFLPGFKRQESEVLVLVQCYTSSILLVKPVTGPHTFKWVDKWILPFDRDVTRKLWQENYAR